MAPALRADGIPAERAVGQGFHDPVRAVGMVQGAHDLEGCRLPADGAGAVLEVRRGEDEVADRAFVPAIPFGDPREMLTRGGVCAAILRDQGLLLI